MNNDLTNTIRNMLIVGPMDSLDIQAKLQAEGFPITHFARCMRRAGCDTRKVGIAGKWQWFISQDAIDRPKVTRPYNASSQMRKLVTNILSYGPASSKQIVDNLANTGFPVTNNLGRLMTSCGAKCRKVSGQGQASGWEWFIPATQEATND